MNKYKVKLKGKLLGNSVIVEADNFKVSEFFDTVTFLDNQNNNIALFSKNQIKYINVIQREIK